MKKEFTEQQIMQNIKNEEEALKRHHGLMEKLRSMLLETTTTIETLEELQKNNEKVLFGIGSGVLVEVKAEQLKKCKRAIANGIFGEETVNESIKHLKEKQEKIKTQLQAGEKKLAEINKNLSLWTQIANAIREEKKKQINISK